MGFVTLAAALMLPPLAPLAHASPTESPEHETLRVSKMLRPISDDIWKQVAGEQIMGKYDITRGDTLYDISKRLFGDARYWPKIWSLNNGSILNPHLIRPGNRIAFMPGTGTSLPTVGIESSDPTDTEGKPAHGTLTDAEMSQLPPIPKIPPRSQEWKMLPEQSWEAARIAAEQASKNELTVMGSLDKVHTINPTRELPIFAATQSVPVFGEIVSAPAQNTYLRTGDQILIRGLSQDIKPGETYGITHSPVQLEQNEKKRQGLGYHVDGEVQIIGIQNNYWLGAVKQARSTVERGSLLIALPPRLKQLEPIPAPASLQGQFYVDKAVSTFIAGQYSYGFINLGTEDGIQEGMILESYQDRDLNTGRPLGTTDVFHVADMQVVQVSERFSTVQVVAGATEVYDGMPVHLLTDLSHLQKYGAISSGADTPPAPEAAPSEPPPPAPEAQPTDGAQSLDEPAPAPSADIPPPVTAPVVETAPVAPPAPVPVPTPAPEAVPPPPAPEAAPQAAPTAKAEELPAPPPPPPAEPPTTMQAPAPASQQPPTPVHTPNELDALDGEDKLKPSEEKELQQLENYKAKVPTPPETTGASPEAPSGAAPGGAPDAPPPPVSPDTAPPPPPAPTDNNGVQVF
jgi:hypothetical protein